MGNRKRKAFISETIYKPFQLSLLLVQNTIITLAKSCVLCLLIQILPPLVINAIISRPTKIILFPKSSLVILQNILSKHGLIKLDLNLSRRQIYTSLYFNSVQSLSRVRLFATPWTAAYQASRSITNSWSLLKLMSIESMMLSNHLILWVYQFVFVSIQ